MYKTKDGTSRSKAPVEESHVTNTSTLRSVFAKSAKLEAFDVLDTLGTGTFGRVRLCRHTDTGRYQALKIMKKSEVVRLKQVDHIKSEKEILTAVQHPFIITLYGVFQDERNLYMVLEYVPGGELFTHLRKAGKFTNDQTRFYAAQIVMAVQALHADSIVYRDLKPENLLLDEDGYLKITDFGFAKYVEDRTWTLCGTPEYLAPEIIQSRGHGKAVDWWALGILVYEMLAGYPPYYDESPFGIYQKILAAKLEFPRHFETHARDLVRKLLTADRTKRIGNLKGGAEDIKKHKWFRGLNWAALYNKQIPAPIVPEIDGPGDTRQYDKYADSSEESGPLLQPSQHQQFFGDCVCVVGAGAAGLAAADALARAGWRVTVLEARDRVGGRCAHAVLAGVDVDLGAEFSHGDGAVLALCADAHVSPRALYSWDEDAPADLRARLSVDGALLDPSGDHAVPRACRALYEELMSDARWSIGTSASADVSFASLARARGLPPAVVGALDAMHAVEYATCLDDLGVVEWRRREEVLSGRSCSTDFSLLGKYTHALGWLARRAVAAGARLRLASAVRCVAALDAEACVLVDGERFDRAIVTVPLGVLQSGEVRLDGVSIAFREAVRAVRFHGASKVIVAIAPAEWARQLPGGQPLVPMVLCAGDAGDFARQIWTRVSEPAGIVIVTGFLAGPRDCAAAEALTTDEAAESLLAQLARVLGCAFPPLRCVDALKIDWRADEWSRGGYSSPTVGAVGAWRRLQRTGSRVLLYAGEAAHERGSTVDSALESGRRAAAELGLALALASGGVHAAASAAPSSI